MIDVIFTVWIRNAARLITFKETVASLKKFADFGDLPYKYIAAIETDRAVLQKELSEFCEKEHIEMHYKHTPASLSSMLNFANSLGDSEFILFMQDDWGMIRYVNMQGCVQLLLSDPAYFMLRFRNHQFDRAKDLGGGIWLLAPNMNGYYYSDNPHLKRRAYHLETGEFVDSIRKGVDQGRCENAMNGRAKKIGKRCQILSLREPAFRHLADRNTTLTEKTFER